MKIPNFSCLSDGAGDGGSGGGPGDAGGGSAGDLSGGGGGDGAAKAYDLNDDTPIRIKGQKDPVKFGDWYKGLRSSQTTATQKAAEFERKYGESSGQIKTLQKQYDDLLQAVQKARNTGDKSDALAELRKLEYIDGNAAAQIVEAVQSRIAASDQGFQTTNRAIMFLGQKLAEAMKKIEGYDGERQQTGFKAKIGNFLKDAGYSEDYRDLAQEIYLAYEGEDLDEEFPGILKSRIAQIERAMKAQEAKRKATRAQNAFIPGAERPQSPSGALRDKRLARGKPKDIADAIWDATFGDQPSDRT